MTFLELAQKVLEEAEYPLSSSQIWKIAEENGYTSLLDSQGKTPASTLASQLYTRTKLRNHDRIGIVNDTRPVRFCIVGKEYPYDAWDYSKKGDPDDVEKELSYKESDLHPLLAWFIRTKLIAYPKTINHSKSKKSSYRQWEHPDMVACGFPEGVWKTKAYEVSIRLGGHAVEYYSFEIKKSLSFSNLRESFFQAVSNSSWAHHGYLVAAEISNDIEFEKEVSRLSNSFGIGLIRLDTKVPELSEVLLDADIKDETDLAMMSKLCGNLDFNDFLEQTMKDLDQKDIREDRYDKLWEIEDLVKKFNS
ncbi:MAG: HTH domain-containing protein [Ekhidna sp.]|uniref:HTH domain-containing protein n=1 Tax=Ekhidna sp. TaxID=2608089 RepID=UPI0032EEE27F